MPKVIEVVYENGVFRPLGKVSLEEGERIRITIESSRKEKRLMFLNELKPIKLEKSITVKDIQKLRLERYESIH